MKRAALVLLLLVHCGVDLPFPDAVSCQSDGDCREGVCYEGQCVDRAAIDVTPPRLVLISVASPQAVVLTFDERLDPSTITALGNYTATPALTFTNAAIGSEGQTVVLALEGQTAGQAYDLRLTAIADLAGNVIAAPNNGGSFTGATRSADTLAPVTIDPPSGARLFDTLAVRLSWTPRVGAHTYTVELATDPELASPVAGSPFTVDAGGGAEPPASLSLQLPNAAQYYWRVDSDIAARRGEIATFAVIGDRLHVYCPPGPTCTTGGNGTVTSPFQTIGQAMADAVLHAIPRIDVAARGDGSAYAELVILEQGIDLYGGYTAQFDESSRDSVAHPTMVQGPAAYTVYGEDVWGPLTIDGFHFRAGAAPTTHVIQLDNVHNITFDDVVIDAEPGAQPAQEWIGVHIVDSSNGCQYRYPSCDASDPDCPLYCTAQSITLRRPSISVPATIGLAAGVFARDGEVEVSNGTITVADMPRRALGFMAAGGSVSYGVRFNVQSVIRDSSITTGEADESYAVAQDGQSFVSVGTIERNTIRAGDATYRSVGVSILSLTGLILANNDVQAGLAAFSYGAQLNTSNDFVSITSNNTIGSGPIRIVDPPLTGQSTALTGARSYILANNILFVREVPSSAGRCVALFAFPGRIESNLFFGCQTVWANVTGDPNSCASYAMLNGWSADAGVCMNNEVGGDLSTYFTAFASGDMHLAPAATPSVRYGGIATSAFPYGQVTVDHDGKQRSCTGAGACYSRGAYEAD